MRRPLAVALLLGMFAVSLYTAAAATADGGNNQSTQQLCRDADYADLHPTLCAGPFGFGGGGGGAPAAGGGGTGVLGGLPVVGPILKGLGL